VVRELRVRHDDRPPFRVMDEKDLEDLLRALLPLHFDTVRPQTRTPRYSASTRTDFLLAPERIAVMVKIARPSAREPQLADQLCVDATCYRTQRTCDAVVCYVHDPESVLREPRLLANTQELDGLQVRCVVGALDGTSG
jgi:hypothetical protein